MSTINVDSLFEQHSIADIDLIQNRIRAEVENKREELRVMVGERYRDLLQAADTIAVMKDTAKSLTTEISGITEACQSLNDKRLLGFQTEAPPDTHAQIRKVKTYFGTVVQIKILTSMPEMIWTELEDKRLFKATQLFILARHISTGLQVDADNNFTQYFPVAKKQWAILNPFFFTIKQKCLEILKTEHLTPEIASDCLLSLFLLEKTNLESILENFVSVRIRTYLTSMTNDLNKEKRVKDRILSSLKVLYSTVDLIFKCFLDSGTRKGLIEEELLALASENSPPTISYYKFDNPQSITTLPDIIAKFRPVFDSPSISSDALKKLTSQWLQKISEAATHQLKDLFELVSSIKTIQELKKESQFSIEKSSDWSYVCERVFFQNELDFYHQFYAPLLKNRTQSLVSKLWEKTLTETLQEIQKVLTSKDATIVENEFTFVWHEDGEDVPKSLQNALSQDKKQNNLLMKSLGFNPKIVEICSNFDQRLEAICADVSAVLSENETNHQEKEYLTDFLRDISQEQVNELITKIKNLEYEKTFGNLVILARLLTAFTELCPNLKQCLSQSYNSEKWNRPTTADKKISEKWSKVSHLFEEEAYEMWKQFCTVFLNDFHVEEFLSTNLGLDTILNDFVNWEITTIEEKDDQDNAINSTIRIPAQPSISIQKLLNEIIKSMNQYIPQTLAQMVQLYFNDKLIDIVLNIYARYNQTEFIKSNQNMALQLYFDLKFMQIIFSTRENHKKANEEVQRITLELKNFVDPFDFELFHLPLMANAKKCAQHQQNQLGFILVHSETISNEAKTTSSAGIQDRDPNVLCLSSNGVSATWFPMLPIIVPGNKASSVPTLEIEKVSTSSKPNRPEIPTTQRSKQRSPSPARSTTQNYANNVKSGAAAFFGAMSQDWFR